MAFTTPRTWVTGETVSAAQLNEQVRDNENFLFSPPGCKVYRATNQTITTGSGGADVSFSNERYDTDGMWAIGSPTIVDINTNGRYLLVGQIIWAAEASSTYRILRFYVGSAIIGYDARHPVQTAGTQTAVSLTTINPFTSSDQIKMFVAQNTGGSLDIVAGNGSPELALQWIGA